MVTDDPGTPGDGHWEINLASIGSRSSSYWLIAVPDADINYGWGERVQLKIDTPLNLLGTTSTRTPGDGYTLEKHVQRRADAPAGAAAASNSASAPAPSRTDKDWTTGLGTSEVGVKWRYFDDEASGWTASMYPQLGLNLDPNSGRRGLANPGKSLFLPLEAAGNIGPISLDVEVGRNFQQQGGDQWIGGIVLAHAFVEGYEVMFETRRQIGGSSASTLLNLGSRWELSKTFSFLGAVGHDAGASSADRAIVLVYLGIQIRL